MNAEDAGHANSPTPLTVLQVNTGGTGGGARNVMFDLHREYLSRGIDAWVATSDHPLRTRGS